MTRAPLRRGFFVRRAICDEVGHLSQMLRGQRGIDREGA